MKRTTTFGMAVLGATAMVGIGCATATGGSASNAPPAVRASGGVPVKSSAPVHGVLKGTGPEVLDGYLEQGQLKGPVGTVVDGNGSTMARAADSLCGSGRVVATNAPGAVAAWGAALGWYLNREQGADGKPGAPSGADVSAFKTFAVGLSGASKLNLRVQVGVQQAGSDGLTWYCTSLPSSGTAAEGIPLSSLVESCWQGEGRAFDPATMRPVALGVLVLSERNRSQPFDFCITDLRFK